MFVPMGVDPATLETDFAALSLFAYSTRMAPGLRSRAGHATSRPRRPLDLSCRIFAETTLQTRPLRFPRRSRGAPVRGDGVLCL